MHSICLKYSHFQVSIALRQEAMAKHKLNQQPPLNAAFHQTRMYVSTAKNGDPPLTAAFLTLIIQTHGDNHRGSVPVIVTVLPSSICHEMRIPEFPTTMTALVMMMVMTLLLTLYTYIRHYHLRSIAKPKAVAPKVTSTIEITCHTLQIIP
uniref:Uncharacterized protein n=1 Tax=Lutzomyia longipalpis TaxID=7200 RepID=A0A1B0CWN0_LUTLO